MPGQVEIVNKEIDAADDDLVVLPCSDTGSIVDVVHKMVTARNWTLPPKNIKLNSVHLARKKANGKRWAWAVWWEPGPVVEDADAEKIGIRLGQIAANSSGQIQSIAVVVVRPEAPQTYGAPIERVVRGFLATSPDDTILRIYVKRQNEAKVATETLAGLNLLQTKPASHSLIDIPEDLIAACAAGDCVLYAGSGLSAPAGLPTWMEFVTKLLEAARELSETGLDVRSLELALGEGYTDVVADEIVSHLGAHELRRIVAGIFKDGTPNAVHREMVQFGFAGILTTNFDTLIEDAFREFGVEPVIYTPSEMDEISAMGKNSILKLYGDAEASGELLVAPAQYQEAVARNVPFGRAMSGLFSSRTMLFMGCSLEGIDDYLSGLGLSGSLDQTPRQHYALVNSPGEAWRPRANLLQRRYNIKVIPFELTAPSSYDQTFAFLHELREKKTARTTPEKRDTAHLSWVHLENVGPFGKLALRLDPETTVIVGDNGMGKSSILRAIAASLCGDDASRYAVRLVKSGSKSAAVRLTTTKGRRYATEIFLTDAMAEVVTRPARPLEAELWMALGFPAVRMFGTGGDPTRVTRPTAADLIPLLCSEPDFRLSDLKEWLVTQWIASNVHIVEYSATDGISERVEGSMKKVFEILRKVTPGIKLEVEGVDPATKSVTVSTGSGPIRFEDVSQGTAALIGWIAVVMQRLFDRFGEKWEDEYVLILIDEIDAHMHPRWQQVVLQVVREVFPKAQIIATSHSPLVVGTLRPDQIYVIDRNLETRELEAQQPEEDLLMLRADQILTSEAFKLEVTRPGSLLEGVYETLKAKKKRTGQEEERFRELERRLGEETTLSERPEDRWAEKALRQLLDTVFAPDGILEELPPERKQEILGRLSPLAEVVEEGE